MSQLILSQINTAYAAVQTKLNTLPEKATDNYRLKEFLDENAVMHSAVSFLENAEFHYSLDNYARCIKELNSALSILNEADTFSAY